MRFIHIVSQKVVTNELLNKAANSLGIEMVEIDSDNKHNFLDQITLKPGDLMYRSRSGALAKLVEQSIMQEGVATFYKNYERVYVDYKNTDIIYDNAGISTPRTIYQVSQDKDVLSSYVEHLGGFPIIVKVMGGSHGIGVIKVDSYGALFSLVDYLLADKTYRKIVLKQFIKADTHARLIVLGDKVVDSIEYIAAGDDFRTNVGDEPQVVPKKFGQEVEEIAIKSVEALDLEFGGADVIIDEAGKGYLLELNFPCFFGRSQLATGNNIAEQMLNYLIDKSKDNV